MDRNTIEVECGMNLERDGGGNQIYIDFTRPASVWLYLHDEGSA